MTFHRLIKMGRKSPKIRMDEPVRYFGKSRRTQKIPLRYVKGHFRTRFNELHLGRCSSEYAWFVWQIPTYSQPSEEESVIADDARGQQDGQ